MTFFINMSDNKQPQQFARNNNVPVAYNDTSFSGNVANYKNAVADWQTRTNQYWNAKNSARENGGAFLCVEPPKKPKFEDFI